MREILKLTIGPTEVYQMTSEEQAQMNDVMSRELATPEAGKVKRQPVDFNFESLNWDFIKCMAMIANYASTKYGSATQYTNGRLEGGNSPINHIVGHVREYVKRQPHDRFNNLEMQLAAIAYNAMMEYYYLQHGGPTAPGVFYE